MAVVEVDTTIVYSTIGTLVIAISFMFKWILGQFQKLETKAEQERLTCLENAKIQNQLIADLQKQLVDFSYKLGLLEGRSLGEEHYEAEQLKRK
jgi:hypothetical protein